MSNISVGDGAMVMGTTPPPPNTPPKPTDQGADEFRIRHRAVNVETPVLDAEPLGKIPVEPEPRKEDPADRVPQHQVGYHTIKPALPDGMTWDDDALAPFFGSIHKAQLKPSQAKAVLEYYAPTVAFLRSEAIAGNFDSALEKAATGLKMRLEAKGATRPQIEAVIKAALAWIEPRAGYEGAPAIFGRQTDPAKSFASEKPTGLTPEKAALYTKLLQADRGTPEYDRLAQQWRNLFPKGGVVSDD
jgi:hypothetical protein